MAATASAPRQSERSGNGESPLSDLLNKPTGYDRPELLQRKMENESIMAECRVNPRDFDTIKADLLQQLQAFPELATDAIYEKPVGGGKFARGLSVRAAEALAEAYGYNRIRSDVAELNDDKVKVEATFTDYQKGRVWQDAGILSKTYKSASGTPARWNDDRFYNVVVKAEVSKRIREVILRSVNTGLKAWFENECEKIAAGLLDDDTIERIVNQYKTKGVDVVALETLVGRPRAMGWTNNDRQRLLNIWNAIKDGETSLAEVFGDKPAKPLPNPTKSVPQAPEAPPAPAGDTDLLATARKVISAETTEDGVNMEADAVLAGATTDAERDAIQAMRRDRIAELRQAAAPKGKQKTLAGT
jgi:hypothetical protein